MRFYVCRISQNRTRDIAHFHVIGNGGDRFCVSNAHCIERYFEGLTAIYRQGWAKSTSKNVAKAYLDIQILL